MAKHTFETTSAEEAGLQFVTDRLNLERTAINEANAEVEGFEPLPILTPAEYLSCRIKEVLGCYSNQCVAEQEKQLLEKFRNADEQTKSEMLN
jgi:hypothetical protein